MVQFVMSLSLCPPLPFHGNVCSWDTPDEICMMRVFCLEIFNASHLLRSLNLPVPLDGIYKEPCIRDKSIRPRIASYTPF